MKSYTTRRSTDLCLLCLQNLADNKNAHIITKLLTRGIFGADKRGKAYVLIVKGEKVGFSKKPEQDTPTEDYMVCTSCERRMEKIETYVGNTFYQRYRKAKYREEFPVTHSGLLGSRQFDYLTPTKVDSYLFSLFVWMQLWRSSVTQSEAFKDVKMPPDSKERLRLLLNSCLKEGCIQTAEYCQAHPEMFSDFVYNVVMPRGEFNPESQIVGARTVAMNLYLVYAAGMLFVCRPNDKAKTGVGFNNGSSPLVMAMMPVKDWDEMKWKAMLPPDFYQYIAPFHRI
jgi:hypothetical protein